MPATLTLVHVVAWQEYLERENLNHRVFQYYRLIITTFLVTSCKPKNGKCVST